jgi:hypothetical protein
MSHKRKIIIVICKRAAYLLFNNASKTSRVVSHKPDDITTLRQLISRCYQIS